MPTRMNKEGSSHTMIDAFRARADELGPPGSPGDSAPTTTSPRAPTATASSRRPSPAPRRATRRPSASSTSATRTTSTATSGSIVRDDYEAEDVTQHVFAKLMTVCQVRAALRAVRRLDPPGRAQRRGRPHARPPRHPLRGGPRARRAQGLGDSQQTSIALREALADAARGAARGHRAAPRRRPHPRRDRRPDGQEPSPRSTACTTAAAARSGPTLAERECAPAVRIKAAA